MKRSKRKGLRKRLRRIFLGIKHLLPYELQHPIYWLKSHTIARWHVLDLRNEEYEWGWRDTDSRILYACFNLLQQFVEGEKPFDRRGFEEDSVGLHVKQEIEALYGWWTDTRPQRSERDDIWESLTAHSNSDYAEDQEMLERLLAIREHLWT